MVRARDGQFDAVVAIYHDQGHIALKLLGMHKAVNVTLGLPIIRTTSPTAPRSTFLAAPGRVQRPDQGARVASRLARRDEG